MSDFECKMFNSDLSPVFSFRERRTLPLLQSFIESFKIMTDPSSVVSQSIARQNLFYLELELNCLKNSPALVVVDVVVVVVVTI